MSSTLAEPLYQLLRQIRRPVTIREIIASCLRNIYTRADGRVPRPPGELMEAVMTSEVYIGDIRCVIYLPPNSEIRPLLLYFHGGAFVVGSTEDVDYIARRICFDNSVTVISINYSLAPEHMFPSALHDCLSVYNWSTENASDLGIDASRVYLAGDSAGGNLAAALSLQLHKQGRDAQGLVMLAPWLDMYVEKYDSYSRSAYDGIVMDAAYLGYARASYAKFDEWTNSLVSPQMASIEDFPPTIALVGTEDPLHDQVVGFGEKAKSRNRQDIEIVVYEGMPHSFYQFPGLFEQENDCFEQIARFLGEQATGWASD